MDKQRLQALKDLLRRVRWANLCLLACLILAGWLLLSRAPGPSERPAVRQPQPPPASPLEPHPPLHRRPVKKRQRVKRMNSGDRPAPTGRVIPPVTYAPPPMESEDPGSAGLAPEDVGAPAG